MQALLTDAIYSPYFTKSITWTDAISSYNKALELNPNDSWSYIGRGIVYYEQSVEQDPSDYGLMQDAYGEFDQALKLEETNRKNTPDPNAYIQGKAWVNIGNIWSVFADESREDEQSFTERYDFAVTAYENALREYAAAEERDPDNQAVDGRYYAHAHYGLGKLYLLKASQDDDQDMYSKARKSYTTCLELADPDDPRATPIRQLCEEGQQKAADEIR
jgi:tetratricopeptide (TPR) repeat protein